jgi:hypothetical protein
MALSFRKMQDRGASRVSLTTKLIARSCKLFAVGLFLNNGNDLGNWCAARVSCSVRRRVGGV